MTDIIPVGRGWCFLINKMRYGECEGYRNATDDVEYMDLSGTYLCSECAEATDD